MHIKTFVKITLWYKNERAAVEFIKKSRNRKKENKKNLLKISVFPVFKSVLKFVFDAFNGRINTMVKRTKVF